MTEQELRQMQRAILHTQDRLTEVARLLEQAFAQIEHLAKRKEPPKIRGWRWKFWL